MATKRRCEAMTKRGTRCRAAPLKEGSYCSAHDPDRPDAERFGSPEQAKAAALGGGRPRLPAALEILRDRIEDDIDRWLQPIEEALVAEKPLLMWDADASKHVIEYVPDLPTRLRAVEIVLNRVYGRPRELIELAEPEERPNFEAENMDPAVQDATRALARAISRVRERPPSEAQLEELRRNGAAQDGVEAGHELLRAQAGR